MSHPALALAQRSPALWSRVRDFNFALSRDATATRLPDIPAPVLAALNASPRGARRLSEQLLAREHVDPALCLDFQEPPRRLALFEPAVLDRLTSYAGAAIYADRLARIIDGSVLRAVRQSLSVDLYSFALRRAPFFHRPPPELLSRHQGTPDAPENYLRVIQRAGQDAVEVCLAGAPVTLTRRFALKFPADRAWRFDLDPKPGLRDKTWAFLHRLTLQEIAPESAAWLS